MNIVFWLFFFGVRWGEKERNNFSGLKDFETFLDWLIRFLGQHWLKKTVLTGRLSH